MKGIKAGRKTRATGTRRAIIVLTTMAKTREDETYYERITGRIGRRRRRRGGDGGDDDDDHEEDDDHDDHDDEEDEDEEDEDEEGDACT